MRKVRVAGTVLAMLVLAAVAVGCGDDEDGEGTTAGDTTESTANGEDGGTGSTTTLEIAAQDFQFDPATLDGEPGATVTVSVTNEGEAPHTFTVDDPSADAEVQPGGSANVEVTLPESGELAFYCRFHQGRGMEGTVAVGGDAAGSSGTPAPPAAPADETSGY